MATWWPLLLPRSSCSLARRKRCSIGCSTGRLRGDLAVGLDGRVALDGVVQRVHRGPGREEGRGDVVQDAALNVVEDAEDDQVGDRQLLACSSACAGQQQRTSQRAASQRPVTLALCHGSCRAPACRRPSRVACCSPPSLTRHEGAAALCDLLGDEVDVLGRDLGRELCTTSTTIMIMVIMIGGSSAAAAGRLHDCRRSLTLALRLLGLGVGVLGHLRVQLVHDGDHLVDRQLQAGASGQAGGRSWRGGRRPGHTDAARVGRGQRWLDAHGCGGGLTHRQQVVVAGVEVALLALQSAQSGQRQDVAGKLASSTVLRAAMPAARASDDAPPSAGLPTTA